MSGKDNLEKRRVRLGVRIDKHGKDILNGARPLARGYTKIAEYLKPEFPEASKLIKNEASKLGLPDLPCDRKVNEGLLQAAIVSAVNLLHRNEMMDAARKLVEAGGRM